MRPGARVAAAIDILDQIAEGDLPTEQALTRWARGSRFAGSKDRAAIRDYVFDVARQYRLAAHYGQGETGRALMIGLLHIQSIPHDELFNGDGHAPAPLTEVERSFPDAPTDEGILWNLPDWLCGTCPTGCCPPFATVWGTRRHRPRAPCKTARPLPCASTPPEPLWPR